MRTPAKRTALIEKSRARLSCIIDHGLAWRLQDVGKNEKRLYPGGRCKGCLDTIQADPYERTGATQSGRVITLIE